MIYPVVAEVVYLFPGASGNPLLVFPPWCSLEGVKDSFADMEQPSGFFGIHYEQNGDEAWRVLLGGTQWYRGAVATLREHVVVDKHTTIVSRDFNIAVTIFTPAHPFVHQVLSVPPPGSVCHPNILREKARLKHVPSFDGDEWRRGVLLRGFPSNLIANEIRNRARQSLAA